MVRKRQLLSCFEDCFFRMYSFMIECWNEIFFRRLRFKDIYVRFRFWEGFLSYISFIIFSGGNVITQTIFFSVSLVSNFSNIRYSNYMFSSQGIILQGQIVGFIGLLIFQNQRFIFINGYLIFFGYVVFFVVYYQLVGFFRVIQYCSFFKSRFLSSVSGFISIGYVISLFLLGFNQEVNIFLLLYMSILNYFGGMGIIVFGNKF